MRLLGEEHLRWAITNWIEAITAQPRIWIIKLNPRTPELVITASGDDGAAFARWNLAVDEVECLYDFLAERCCEFVLVSSP